MQKNDSTNVIDLSSFALKGHLTPTDTPVYQFVADEAAKEGMTVNALGDFIHPKGDAEIFIDYLLLMNQHRDKSQRFSRESIDSAINYYIHTERKIAEQKFCATLMPNEDTKPYTAMMAELEAMLALGMPDDSEVSPTVAACVMAKTVWQAKRKLNNVRVTDHLMLVFVGEQHGGKTWFVEKFTSPASEMRLAQLSFAELTDTRNITIFKRIIGVMDEMAKAGKADIEDLKSIITAESLTRRPMRTNRDVEVSQRLTLVGTSNRDVNQIIIDETGNRRFFQIDLIGPKHERIAAFRAAQDAFDWLDFWRSVDHTSDDPCRGCAEDVRVIQEGRQNLSPVEIWLRDDEETIRRACKENGIDNISADELFTPFDTWCHTNNFFKMTSESFKKTLKPIVDRGRCKYLVWKKNPNRGYRLV